MLIEIVLESQGFEGKDQKTSVYKNRARVKMFLVQGEDKNFNVYKNIGPEFQCLKDKMRIPMFGSIRS